MEGLPEELDIDMIVFDVDGTLLDFRGFHPELIPLIRQLEERGIIVSLASGRTLPNITPIRQALGISGFIVAENGGVVWDSSEGMRYEYWQMVRGLRRQLSGCPLRLMDLMSGELSPIAGEKQNGV